MQPPLARLSPNARCLRTPAFSGKDDGGSHSHDLPTFSEARQYNLLANNTEDRYENGDVKVLAAWQARFQQLFAQKSRVRALSEALGDRGVGTAFLAKQARLSDDPVPVGYDLRECVGGTTSQEANEQELRAELFDERQEAGMPYMAP